MAEGLRELSLSPASPTGGDGGDGARRGDGASVNEEANRENLIC